MNRSNLSNESGLNIGVREADPWIFKFRIDDTDYGGELVHSAFAAADRNEAARINEEAELASAR